MLRIYLDIHYLTKLDKYPLLKEKLSIYSDYLNIVYSSAHIDDLRRSSDIELTNLDLAQIKCYSESQCLAKYWGVDELCYDTRDPFEFYESFRDTSFDISDTLKNLDFEFKMSGLENPFDKLGFSKSNLEDDLIKNEKQLSTISLKRFKKELTFKSLFEDIGEIIQNSLTSNNLLNEARLGFDKHIPRKVIGNVKTNIVDYLNGELPNTIYHKTFDQLVIDSLKIRNKDKTFSVFDWFISRYSLLDLIGYKSDNKSVTSNIITDAFHAYYGAHCDIFLSEDKKLRAKAKVIYDEFGIDTCIFSEKEFCEKIDDLIVKLNSIKDIEAFLKKVKYLDIKNSYSDLDSKSTVTERSLDTFFAGYFDCLIFVSTIDNFTIANFIKTNHTFSKWYYYKELNYLIKTLTELLGPDMNNKLEFDSSTEYSDEKVWIGRRWLFENLVISLKQDAEYGIVLRFETLVME